MGIQRNREVWDPEHSYAPVGLIRVDVTESARSRKPIRSLGGSSASDAPLTGLSFLKAQTIGFGGNSRQRLIEGRFQNCHLKRCSKNNNLP